MKGDKIRKTAYHRNGISGEGFVVAMFDSRDGPMLGIMFPEYEGDVLSKFQPRVAVLNIDRLGDGIIGMHEGPGNAWRGADSFGDTMRRACEG